MQNEGKDTKGRSYDQIAKDGSTSAGSMGAGATGDIGAMPDKSGSAQRAGQGGMQSGGRTDDLLAGGTDDEQSDKGFQSGNQQQGGPDAGMGGLRGGKQGGAGGNRQSGELNQQGIGGQRTTEVDRDEGTSAREP